MPPLDGGMGGGDPRLHASDTEGHQRHMHMYVGAPMGMQSEGPLMDRACQSSLPSLANECMHSPGYRSSRNGDSPVSEGLPDYAGESDLDAARTTDCPTPESSVNGEGDGSISDADFASAVARAAELSGMTVVGTTVTDPKAGVGKKYRKTRSTAPAVRPTSPYSTDSNFSAVVHRPYPKSDRKKQLLEQARRYGGRLGNEQLEGDFDNDPNSVDH